MNEQINNIFQELCRLEPTFKEQEDAIMDAIKAILESRPDTKFSEAFAKQLRLQLLADIPHTTKTETVFGNIMNQFKHMTNIYKFAAPIAVVVVIAAGALYYTNQNSGLYLAKTDITKNGESNAFGSLLAQDGKGIAQDSAITSEAAPRMAAGFGGGGGGEVGFYPGPANYKYIYVGDDLNLTDQEVDVLRRTKGSSAGSAVSDHLATLDFGVFNVGSFSKSTVQNISFSEDRDWGYVVNVSFLDGSISINENWQYWEHPGEECRDQACYDKYKLTESNIPSDSKLISIANAFLREHNISAAPYGEPFVDKQWRVYYDEGEASELYVPDAISVKYPIMVNGETVYEQGGDAAGLMVNVNIRFNRVSSLWGLTSQQYEASGYAAETNAQKIIQIAEAGGLYGYLLPARNALEIKLGTPKRILMRQYNYQNGESQELLVPALSFPVVEAPDEVSYYQKRPIIIPLAQELLVRDGGPIIFETKDVVSPIEPQAAPVIEKAE